MVAHVTAIQIQLPPSPLHVESSAPLPYQFLSTRPFVTEERNCTAGEDWLPSSLAEKRSRMGGFLRRPADDLQKAKDLNEVANCTLSETVQVNYLKVTLLYLDKKIPQKFLNSLFLKKQQFHSYGGIYDVSHSTLICNVFLPV